MLYRPQKYPYILVCDNMAMLYRLQKYPYIQICDMFM